MKIHALPFVLGVLCLTTQLRADYLVSGSNGSGLSASADFRLTSGPNPALVITLTNTSTADVTAPNQVLTALFFDAKGSPSFSPVSVDVASGSSVLFPNANGDCAATPASLCSGPNVSGEWAYLSGLSGAPFGLTYGISSSGLGLFGPGNLFGTTNLQGPASPGGLDYGITSAGDNPTTGNKDVTGKYALINNSVVITLSLPTHTTFTLSDIQDVAFQYGTALTDADFTVLPEPSTYAGMIFLTLLPLAWFHRKRRNRQPQPGSLKSAD
jgi:hypothetical protein